MQDADNKNKSVNDQRVVVAIPARFHSLRLPGKPLADIGGVTMIQRVYKQAAKAGGISQVLVATDDKRILKEVESFGGMAVMTRGDHKSGTDRLAEVFENRDADMVINVQGDEPFLDPESITALIEDFTKEPNLRFATLKTKITDPADLLDPSVAKLVVDKNDYALYFSRSPIPFIRDVMEMDSGAIKIGPTDGSLLFKHIGLYAYTRDFLLEFASWAPAPLEKLEKLEQLRALHHGVRIKTITVKESGFSVDTPRDLEKANEMVK